MIFLLVYLFIHIVNNKVNTFSNSWYTRRSSLRAYWKLDVKFPNHNNMCDNARSQRLQSFKKAIKLFNNFFPTLNQSKWQNLMFRNFGGCRKIKSFTWYG